MRNYKALKKIIVIISILIVSVLAVSFLMFLEIKEKNKNISKLQNELVGNESESKYLSSIQNIVNSTNASIDQINSIILEKDTEVSTIEKIEKIALRNNLEVSTDSLSIENLSNTEETGITILKIKLKTNGSWIGTHKFISELESFPYKIIIDKVSLMANDTPIVSSKNITGNIWQGIVEIRLLKFK